MITAKVKDEAITAAKVKKGTLTGAQINASTLGTVPTAGNATTAGTASVANSLATPEAWHEVGAPEQPQFQNLCKPVPNRPVKFFKDHEGVVHLEGEYENCVSLAVTSFFLPPGYRPDQNGTYPGVLGVKVNISSSNGGVECLATQCSLNGITFRAG